MESFRKNVGNTEKLHAYIAHAGITSRRKAEDLIVAGKVKVNGSLVKNVAHRIDPEHDIVSVSGKTIEKQRKFVYIVIHKPSGYVSTVADPDGKPTVMSLAPKKMRMYPVGRLDIDSEGIILLTNDGDLTYAISHPKFEVDKTYRVLVLGSPSNTALNTLRAGVRLKEGVTRPAGVELFKHEKGNTWITITIHEGKNRQVRRMCANVGLQTLRLVRVRLGPLELGDLPQGKWREVTNEEKTALQQLVRTH